MNRPFSNRIRAFYADSLGTILSMETTIFDLFYHLRFLSKNKYNKAMKEVFLEDKQSENTWDYEERIKLPDKVKVLNARRV